MWWYKKLLPYLIDLYSKLMDCREGGFKQIWCFLAKWFDLFRNSDSSRHVYLASASYFAIASLLPLFILVYFAITVYADIALESWFQCASLLWSPKIFENCSALSSWKFFSLISSAPWNSDSDSVASGITEAKIEMEQFLRNVRCWGEL